MGKMITCIASGAYQEALTRGEYYEVLDEDDVKKQVKIRDNNHRVRWYPVILFNLHGETIPIISSWEFSTPVDDELDDWIEVNIYLNNGSRRWCSFVTPTHLQRRLSMPNSDPGFWSDHTVIVRSITPELIDKILNILNKNGELLKASRPLGDD
jgi:hypothetical protein